MVKVKLNELRRMALDCGINATKMSAKQISDARVRQPRSDFVDQFDVRLDSALESRGLPTNKPSSIDEPGQAQADEP